MFFLMKSRYLDFNFLRKPFFRAADTRCADYPDTPDFFPIAVTNDVRYPRTRELFSPTLIAVLPLSPKDSAKGFSIANLDIYWMLK
ncbi:hypothetical protein, partial [Maritalea sp.]|uniref:hypothetical protein n=1 Tax=Maritalea sp. TaxID=2003361 RepID=UPI003EF902C8